MTTNIGVAHNHLYGVLALRMDFVSRDAMRRALKIWEADQTRPLGTILIESGSLHPSRAALLDTLVEEHIHVHGTISEAGEKTISGTDGDPVSELQATLKQLLGEPPPEPTTAGGLSPATMVDATPPPTLGGESRVPGTILEQTLADSNTPPTAGWDAVHPTQSDATSYPAPSDKGLGASHLTQCSSPSLNIGGVGLRYSILKHHAKGGLGDVYVARDQELGREVALKEIQERYADRNESRQRFMLEAEITGKLEHPGVVPVYGLGCYSDGRPFYAMRFISGETLRDAIDHFHFSNEAGGRDPGEREVALRELLGRFIAVCNAIGFAHSRGILHRDIKPGNVMLGKFGETLVVDWGLAKVIDRPEIHGDPSEKPIQPSSYSGSTPTMEGSVIGTPQFMSPEQATGQLDAMGPAADIYSLGATLYALLTGESAFPDHTPVAVLDKVKKGTFKPPRLINPSVPPALEAICLKAMARRPEDRYPTTRALVTDIERWLADEPVSVYQEPLAKRLQRWAKRHRQAVTGGVGVGLTLVAALMVSNRLIALERDRTVIAKRESDRHYELARTAVETMLDEVATIDLADVPLMEPIRRRMLLSALAFYQEFLKTRSDDPLLKLDVVRGNGRLGDVHELLGDYKASEGAYKAAIAAYAHLSDSQKLDTQFRRAVASAEFGLGIMLKKSNRFREAETMLRRAIASREKLADAASTPNDRRESALSLYHLGALLARQKNRGADDEKIYRDALAKQRGLLDELRGPKDADVRRDLARNLNNLGILLRDNDSKAALDTFKEAYALQTALEAESPNSPAYVWQAARSATNIGGMYALMGGDNGVKAPEMLGAGRARFQRLVADFPRIPDYRQELAATESNLSRISLRAAYGEGAGIDQAKAAAAEATLLIDHAVTLREGLVKDFPARPDYIQALAIALRQKSDLVKLDATLKPKPERPPIIDQATAIITRSIDLQTELLKQYPSARDYDLELARSYGQAGQIASIIMDRSGEAVDRFQHAVDLLKTSVAANPQSQVLRRELGVFSQYLAFGHINQKAIGKAADAIEVAVAALGEDAEELKRAAITYARALESALAGAPSEGKASPEALAKRCVELLEKSTKLGGVTPTDLANPLFVPLKDRDDFKRIQQAVDARAKAPIG